MDNDDDGDLVLSINEDYNGNGDPIDDDQNNNSIPDFLDDLVTGVVVVANPPSPLEACDQQPNDGFAVFDLTVTEAEILGAQNGLTVTWHETQSDASAGINPIVDPTQYTNLTNPQTVYPRVINPVNGDFDTTTLMLTVIPGPEPNTPTPLETCDDDNDGFAEFILTDKDNEILNGDPDGIVSYHATSQDAANNINPLSSPFINTIPSLQIVFARVVNLVSGCHTTVELSLVVNNMPEVLVVTDYVLADINGDGFEVFDLTSKTPEILGGQDPAVITVNFYETQADALAGVNAIAPATSYINIVNPQTIYVRLDNIETSCFALNEFVLFADPELKFNENTLLDLSIFPNPTVGEVIITNPDLNEESKVIIYSIQGRPLQIHPSYPKNGEINLNLSTLSSGVYFLKISNAANTITKKLIKK